MALKKSIAGFYKEIDIVLPFIDSKGDFILNEEGKITGSKHKEKIFIPQYDVDMHPIEEAEILATWAIGDSERDIPRKPTQEEEHEMLLEYGADYVKQKRKEWQESYDKWFQTHKPLVDSHNDACKALEEFAKSEAGKQHYKDTHGKHIEDSIKVRMDEINGKINEEIQRRKAEHAEREANKALAEAQFLHEQRMIEQAKEADRLRLEQEQAAIDARANKINESKLEKYKRLQAMAQAELERIAIEKAAMDGMQLELVENNRLEAEKLRQDVENERLAREAKIAERERLKTEAIKEIE